MRKNFFYLISLCLTVMFLASCANKTDDAIQFATEYKQIQFDIKGYGYSGDMSMDVLDQLKERLAPFLTENYMDYQLKNRIMGLPLILAWKHNATSYKLDEMHFMVTEKKEDLVNLSYNTNVIFMDENEEEINKTTMEGIITLIKLNNSWKVDFDNFNVSDFLNQT